MKNPKPDKNSKSEKGPYNSERLFYSNCFEFRNSKFVLLFRVFSSIPSFPDPAPG
jgi:hypothetical protein